MVTDRLVCWGCKKPMPAGLRELLEQDGKHYKANDIWHKECIEHRLAEVIAEGAWEHEEDNLWSEAATHNMPDILADARKLQGRGRKAEE